MSNSTALLSLTNRLSVCLLALLVVVSAESSMAAPVYRETFQFCPRTKNGSLDANMLVGWKAVRKGKLVADGGLLKSSEPGSPNALKAFRSFPVGRGPGNVLWIKPTSGLTLFTNEFSFDIGSISSVSYDQRFDGIDPVSVERDGSKLAFLIGNTWYISDQVFNVTKRSVWQTVTTSLAGLTFGTSVVAPGVGPNTPANSGLVLPATGTVSAFGVYIPRVHNRVRIDNFTLLDTQPEGFYGTGEDGDLSPCPDLSDITPSGKPDTFCSETQLSSLGTLRTKGGSNLKKAVVTGLPARTLKGMRDQALLSLIIFASPRTDLLTNVIVADYDITAGVLNLPANVRPDGFFGAVASTIPIKLNKFAKKYMDKYVKRYTRDGNKTKSLFPRVDRGTEKLISTALCTKQFKRLLRLRAEREGIRIKFDF